MKDFEELTESEKDEILKQVQNLPEESKDSLDLFVQSFDDITKTWTDALKEFDSLYYDTLKVEKTSEAEVKVEVRWTNKLKNLLK